MPCITSGTNVYVIAFARNYTPTPKKQTSSVKPCLSDLIQSPLAIVSSNNDQCTYCRFLHYALDGHHYEGLKNAFLILLEPEKSLITSLRSSRPLYSDSQHGVLDRIFVPQNTRWNVKPVM